MEFSSRRLFLAAWQKERVSYDSQLVGHAGSKSLYPLPGTLKRGDQLLEANGESLVGVSNERCHILYCILMLCVTRFE